MDDGRSAATARVFCRGGNPAARTTRAAPVLTYLEMAAARLHGRFRSCFDCNADRTFHGWPSFSHILNDPEKIRFLMKTAELVTAFQRLPALLSGAQETWKPAQKHARTARRTSILTPPNSPDRSCLPISRAPGSKIINCRETPIPLEVSMNRVSPC